MLDLIVVDRRERARLWRNVGSGTSSLPRLPGNFLDITLRQEGSNPAGIGSWIDVEVNGVVTTREVTVGGGHAGGEWGPMHFGLGDVPHARIRVHWPDGTVGRWLDTEANQRVVVPKGADRIEAAR
jgi:hypothetical protein